MLKIAVCVKQVPSDRIAVSEKEGNLIRSQMKAGMNMYDYAALEMALQMRERAGGIVDIFTMGPERAAEVLKEALAYGADRAFLLNDRAFAGADVLATAYTLSCGIKKAGPYDLIVCGLKTTDGDTAQVGGELAANLHITFMPGICTVGQVEGHFFKTQMLTDEQKFTIRTELPTLITVEPSSCLVRVPTLAQRLKSRKKKINVWDALDINADRDRTGRSGSATKVVRLASGKEDRRGEPLKLSGEEAVLLIEERSRSWIKTS